MSAPSLPPVAGRTVSPWSSRGLVGAILVLLAAWIALTAVTGDLRVSQDGSMLVNVLVFGAVGLVVIRKQPENAVGWVLAGVALVILFNLDTKLYSVLDYRVNRGGLPLGRVTLDFSTVGGAAIVLGMLAVLLFPDGRLEGRWRRVAWIYVAIGVLFLLGQYLGIATLHLARHVQVDARGKLASGLNERGWWGASILGLPILAGFWIAFIVHQVRSWRRAAGMQREQLKWLMAGAVVTFGATVTFLFTASGTGVSRIVGVVAALAIGSFPLAIGVGILKYRLYEIDRLISRTISFALLTAALGGVFVGVVLLMTRVLPFSSPVGVAASTLAAAALFTPLRFRLQRIIDRRFNRTRYDAEAILTAFTTSLRNEVELDAIREQLIDTARGAVAPTHASIWIRPST
jgi:hypothetical protein